MAIEIVHEGLAPGQKQYKATCGTCKTIFKFLYRDAHRESRDPREGTLLVVYCPLEGCKREVWVNA